MRARIPTGKPYLTARLRKLADLCALWLVALCLGSISPTYAQSVQDSTIDLAKDVNEAALLDQLLEADPKQAKKIAKDIERLWARSGSASADLLLKRGREALRARKTKIALEHLTALTDHAPDFAEGWHLRASALYQEELYGPALENLGRTLALNPNHFEAIQGLGAIFEQLGDSKRAYEAYSHVLTIHPHHPTVLEAMKRLEATVKGPAL